MAFTNGTLYGIQDGQGNGDTTNSAFNGCNTTNPNLQPKIDLFQILGPGGACLLRVNSAGTVTTNTTTFTSACCIASYQMTTGQALGLASSPSAAQICAAAFPANYNGQQLDIFQIGSFIPTINVAGGGAVIYRLTYNGVGATS